VSMVLSHDTISAIGWVTAAVGVVIISGTEAVGWRNRVPYWKRRVRSLPVEAITAAIVLWSWGLPIGVPLAAGVGAGIVLFEGSWGLHTWLWRTRFWSRVRDPRPREGRR
jgi:hypothetical protein